MSDELFKDGNLHGGDGGGKISIGRTHLGRRSSECRVGRICDQVSLLLLTHTLTRAYTDSSSRFNIFF